MKHDEAKVPFPHERLDAWTVAVDLATQARLVADQIPRGYRKVADEILRSGVAVPMLVAEGANRWAKGQKAQRFNEALGETGECAAGGQLAARMRLARPADVERLLATRSAHRARRRGQRSPQGDSHGWQAGRRRC